MYSNKFNGSQKTQRVKTYSIKGVSIQCCSNPCSITTVPGEDLSSKTGDEAGGLYHISGIMLNTTLPVLLFFNNSR